MTLFPERFVRRSTLCAVALAAVALAVAACGEAGPTTAPSTVTVDSIAVFPGFDIANYPGDAAMSAWRYPSSPYRWVGYYLAAPCHRDVTWANRYAALTTMGWGVAAVYVGQQDWTQIPSATIAARLDAVSIRAVTCSASLLSASQGASEAADAAAKMATDAFPPRSIIFLDVENVATVTPALLDYYRGWVAGILADGRYRPGIYASKRNAPTLYAAALDVFRTAGSSGTPSFWIAAAGNFTIAASPKLVGLDYAAVWQGLFEAAQTWNGVSLTIDADVASSRSPSTP